MLRRRQQSRNAAPKTVYLDDAVIPDRPIERMMLVDENRTKRNSFLHNRLFYVGSMGFIDDLDLGLFDDLTPVQRRFYLKADQAAARIKCAALRVARVSASCERASEISDEKSSVSTIRQTSANRAGTVAARR